MKKTTIFIAIILAAFLFSGVSCAKIKTKLDGGIFKSENGAKSWQQKVNLLSVAGHKSIAGVDVTAMCFNPQDSKILYLGTKKNGLFVSYNRAETWQKVENLPGKEITALVAHPKAKNVFYVASEKKIYKSIDCCHSWQNIYLGINEIDSLAVDSVNSAKIYAGLRNGELIRSFNGGQSWTSLKNFNSSIKQILINPLNTNIIYIVTQGNGLWQSKDNGKNWYSFDKNLSSFSESHQINKIFLDKKNSNTIIILTNTGLLQSNNAGVSWEQYKLLNSKHRVKIYSFVANPNDLSNIYYVTAAALYKSIDSGKNWITKEFPSKRQPVELLIDPNNSNILYLGVAKAE